MDRVRVSRAVIRLGDKGLLARKVQKGDKRVHMLTLTRAGRATYHRIVPVALRLQADLEAMLDADDLRALDRLLTRLTASPSTAG